ncbi:hypothetical protein ABTA99_19590, partial [Acinetobacter baumannii]
TADPDKDGTFSKDEYLAIVERRFRAADPDHDGTLDAKELGTRAGQALLRLMKLPRRCIGRPTFSRPIGANGLPRNGAGPSIAKQEAFG